MIKELILKNFKSYYDQKIEFSPGITVIVGEGLSGKSNIVKAIKLVKNYNSKKNNKFQFALKNDALEIVLITDDNEIKLTQKENVFFQIKNQLTKKYKRKKTPPEVVEALGIDNINIQSQLEQPLIVQQNSSELSKTINRIIGIDKIDAYIKEINHQIKVNMAVLANNVEANNRLLKKLISFEKLPDAKRLVIRSRRYKIKINELSETIGDIQTIIDKVKINNQRISRLRDQSKAGLRLQTVSNIRETIEEKKADIEAIRSIIRNDEIIDNRILGFKGRLEKYGVDYIKNLETQNHCPYCDQVLDDKAINNLKKKLKNEIYLAK